MRVKLTKVWTKQNVKWVCLILSVIMAVTFFLPYFDLDLKAYGLGNFEYSLFDCTKDVVELIGEMDGYTLEEVMDSESLDEEVLDIVNKIKWGVIFVILSYVVLIINLLCFLRKEWETKLFSILHTISFVCFQSIWLIFKWIIDFLKYAADSSLSGTDSFDMESIGSSIGADMVIGMLEGVFKECLGLGYWLFTVIGIVVFVLLILDTQTVRTKILGSTVSDSYSSSDSLKGNYHGDYTLENHGVIRVLSGKYAGAEIAVNAREYIIVGRDPKQCHIILDAPIVSGVHCKIRFSPEENVYYVLDRSTNGTFLVNNATGGKSALIKEQENRLVKGSTISIGNSGDKILLV